MENQILSNAQSGNWLANIYGLEGVVFKARNFIIPSVSSGITDLGGSSNISMMAPGDHIQFEELTFDFLIDYNYKNYKTLFRWLVGNSKLNAPEMKECTLHLLNADGTLSGVSLIFEECWPLNLSAVMLDAENGDTNMQATITMKYTEFDFSD